MKCSIYEVQDRTQELMNRLLYVWENSVRATHYFLSDTEVNTIKQYVPQALAAVEYLIAAYNESGEAVAFMGIEHNRLEMLFISDDEEGNAYPLLYMRLGA